jgi:hypothetical protein
MARFFGAKINKKDGWMGVKVILKDCLAKSKNAETSFDLDPLYCNRCRLICLFKCADVGLLGFQICLDASLLGFFENLETFSSTFLASLSKTSLK